MTSEKSSRATISNVDLSFASTSVMPNVFGDNGRLVIFSGASRLSEKPFQLTGLNLVLFSGFGFDIAQRLVGLGGSYPDPRKRARSRA